MINMIVHKRAAARPSTAAGVLKYALTELFWLALTVVVFIILKTAYVVLLVNVFANSRNRQ